MHSLEKENLDLCKNPNKSYSSSRDTPSYEYEKIFALRRLHATLKEQLKFLANIKHCQEYDLSKLEKISHNVFSWSHEDFLARRQQDNCIWVDVLILKSSLKCLEKQKAVADLKEIQKFVDLIFKAACKGQHEGNIMEDMLWRPLREAEMYDRISESLALEQEQLLIDLKETQARFVTENVTDHLEQQQNRLMALEDIVMNSDVWDPIEVRYELNWYQSVVKQIQYQKELVNSELEQEIDKLNNRIIAEKYCGDSIMDTYYSLVEQYKRRINEFQERFDLEFDELENKNNYLQAQIGRVRDAENFHRQEIERFHREIQCRLEREERAQQLAELKKQEEEAAALAQLEAQKLKKRKKGHVKGGPKTKMNKRN